MSILLETGHVLIMLCKLSSPCTKTVVHTKLKIPHVYVSVRECLMQSNSSTIVVAGKVSLTGHHTCLRFSKRMPNVK